LTAGFRVIRPGLILALSDADDEEVNNLKVAIPRYGERVAPCFEYSATIAIFVTRKKWIVEQKDFVLQSAELFDRLRLLKDQGVDVLICGGIQDRFEDMVKANDIKVVSWVSGDVESLLEQFLDGRLIPESGRPKDNSNPPKAL
jgi:predicted Fe-Mo cluster-binding NifX family protein